MAIFISAKRSDAPSNSMATSAQPSNVDRRSRTYSRIFYRVCAQVIFSAPDAWAIDCNLPVLQDSQPPEIVSTGTWTEGEIGLAIDPFFYKERLVNEAGMPDLFNTWQIIGITREDTPWIESQCGKIFSRDRERPHWTAVQQTDAWNDDSGRSAYLLRLRMLRHNTEGQ
ncbi:hypothetical protein [Pseudomonas sp. NA-150]|uniref:hypothetical protein n=1 Tax=Pseudomonas sp. NA-150 TaxID=3367525 RepID=UPI0037C949C7